MDRKEKLRRGWKNGKSDSVRRKGKRRQEGRKKGEEGEIES